VAVLALVGCAFVAFIPPGFFEGISTTRHMVGMNLATWLCIPLSVGLAVSMLAQLATRRRPVPQAAPTPAQPEVAQPAR
jgi:hypothetical protein